jgi:protocadherin alpha
LDEKYCHHTDESDKCRFYYVYGYDRHGKLYIRAQKTKDCPPDPPIFWIIFGVVGAIVIVGVVMLAIWKCATQIADRREYASFEKERMNAKWDAVSKN